MTGSQTARTHREQEIGVRAWDERDAKLKAAPLPPEVTIDQSSDFFTSDFRKKRLRAVTHNVISTSTYLPQTHTHTHTHTHTVCIVLHSHAHTMQFFCFVAVLNDGPTYLPTLTTTYPS